MFDIKLDNQTNDLKIDRAKFLFVDSAAEIAQRIKIHLKRNLGEWFVNIKLGMPWYPSQYSPGLLGQKSTKSIELALRRELNTIKGIKSIQTLNISTDGRTASAYIEVVTIYGNIVAVGV